MNKTINKFIIASVLIIFFTSSLVLYGYPGGRTGRTLKNSTAGCGGCHGSSAVTDVSVLISGPDTVATGQTKQYTLTISKPSKTGAGLDIATRNGVLAPVSSTIHLANGELTHNSNIAASGGTVTVQFNYTAPAAPVTDTLWATGLATNSDGSESGDDWNWAISKRITVILATGISTNNSEVKEFSISQNYPNPFNPVTKIKFNIPQNARRETQDVKLAVFDALGKEVKVLVDENLSPGSYEVTFDGSNLSAGVYFYKLEAGDFKATKKLLLVK